MSAQYRVHDGLYPTCLLQTLFELQKTDSLCDVTIVVNEDEIRAHKVVLASASPYFRYACTIHLQSSTSELSYVIKAMTP
jgi:hypothetical protein